MNDHRILGAGLIESMPDGIAMYDQHQRIVFANRKFSAMWQLDHGTLLGMSRAELRRHKTAMLAHPQQDAHLLLGGDDEQPSVEASFIELKDGRWYERTAYAHAPDGACLGYVVQWRDVTQRHTAHVLMQAERDLLHDLMDSVPHQIYFKDAESRFTKVNKALAARYGLSDPQDAIGKSDADFYATEHAAQTRQEELQIMATLQPQVNQMHREVWSDGREAWNVSTKMPLIDAHGRVIGVYGIAHDVTEQKRSEAEFWKQANYDTLTGLPNRRLMLDRWDQALQAHRRNGHLLALMLIDLDRFKEVNDQLGHAVGDALLVEASRRMSECLRTADTLARLGGDEFCVILTELPAAWAVDTAARKIINCLNKAFDIQNHTINISGSVGVGLVPDHGNTLDSVMRLADAAMYTVKIRGGNGWMLHDPDKVVKLSGPV